MQNCFQIDLHEHCLRRNISPQCRKREADIIARDYRTISGMGYFYNKQV